ncbi:MAG: helix-turn-helix domain-containing protein, partial [Thermodesulfobacteriota bacterium]
RLNVVPVTLPPLRNRREDIPLLLDHFLRDSNGRNGREVMFSKEVVEFLENYPWPGNVREMQNLVERLVIMADGTQVVLGDLPAPMRAEPETGAVRRDASPVGMSAPAVANSLEELEREMVRKALARNNWVQVRAARELGLTRRQLGYRIRKFGLDPEN